MIPDFAAVGDYRTAIPVCLEIFLRLADLEEKKGHRRISKMRPRCSILTGGLRIFRLRMIGEICTFLVLI